MTKPQIMCSFLPLFWAWLSSIEIGCDGLGTLDASPIQPLSGGWEHQVDVLHHPTMNLKDPDHPSAGLLSWDPWHSKQTDVYIYIYVIPPHYYFIHNIWFIYVDYVDCVGAGLLVYLLFRQVTSMILRMRGNWMKMMNFVQATHWLLEV